MQRGTIVWGSLLIIVGGLLLLDRLGIIIVANWQTLWPLILIGVGLAFLLGVRKDSGPQPIATEHLVMELKGAESAEISLALEQGTLAVNAETPPDQLLAGSFTGGVTYQATDLGDSRIRLSMRGAGNGRIDRAWTMGLNPDMPLALSVQMGAGDVTLDLQDMHISKLDLKTHAGQAEIILPQAAGFTQANVEGAATAITLQIPQDVAASIDLTTTVGILDIDTERFPQTGSVFQSQDYATAVNRIEVVATTGTGSIIVESVPDRIELEGVNR